MDTVISDQQYVRYDDTTMIILILCTVYCTVYQ
jgi:hypothetical protein